MNFQNNKALHLIAAWCRSSINQHLYYQVMIQRPLPSAGQYMLWPSIHRNNKKYMRKWKMF